MLSVKYHITHLLILCVEHYGFDLGGLNAEMYWFSGFVRLRGVGSLSDLNPRCHGTWHGHAFLSWILWMLKFSGGHLWIRSIHIII